MILVVLEHPRLGTKRLRLADAAAVDASRLVVLRRGEPVVTERAKSEGWRVEVAGERAP